MTPAAFAELMNRLEPSVAPADAADGDFAVRSFSRTTLLRKAP
jgi:hypothetical protein